MSIIWPETLPQKFLARGYDERTPNNVIRSKMDQGPDKVRRKSTDAPWVFSGFIRIDESQVPIWLEFYYTTLMEVRSFTFPHPRTGDPITVRVFNNSESAPPLRAVSANGKYELQLALEWIR